MSDELLLMLLAATIALVWLSTLPVSDRAFSRDWEAEAAEFSVRIRPGDQWGR